jgi:TonB family protein
MTLFFLLAFLAAPAVVDDGPAYVTLMEKRIMSVWRLPENSEGKKVVVFMKLDRAGRVSDVRVEKSSGDEAFDESALRAVRTASPFPAVPEAIKHIAGDLRMVLDPTPPAPVEEIPKEVKPTPRPPVPRAPIRPAPKKIPGQQI